MLLHSARRHLEGTLFTTQIIFQSQNSNLGFCAGSNPQRQEAKPRHFCTVMPFWLLWQRCCLCPGFDLVFQGTWVPGGDLICPGQSVFRDTDLRSGSSCISVLAEHLIPSPQRGALSSLPSPRSEVSALSDLSSVSPVRPLV